jgi:hypothetical protein
LSLSSVIEISHVRDIPGGHETFKAFSAFSWILANLAIIPDNVTD